MSVMQGGAALCVGVEQDQRSVVEEDGKHE